MKSYEGSFGIVKGKEDRRYSNINEKAARDLPSGNFEKRPTLTRSADHGHSCQTLDIFSRPRECSVK